MPFACASSESVPACPPSKNFCAAWTQGAGVGVWSKSRKINSQMYGQQAFEVVVPSATPLARLVSGSVKWRRKATSRGIKALQHYLGAGAHLALLRAGVLIIVEAGPESILAARALLGCVCACASVPVRGVCVSNLCLSALIQGWGWGWRPRRSGRLRVGRVTISQVDC